MYQFVMMVLYLTIVGLFAECVFALLKRGGRLHTYLFFYVVSNLIYNCAYVLILQSQNQDTYVTALKIGYFGRIWVGLSMTLFVIELCGTYFPKALKIAAGIFNMVIYYFILNLESNTLYYKRMEFVMDGDFPTLPHSGGPVYYTFTAVNLIYAIYCIYLIVREFIREKNETAKKRNLMMVIAVAVMTASYLIYFFKLVPLARKFDVMIIGYGVCTIFMLIAIVRYGMLDASEAAKNYVVDELSESIIVVDTEDRVNYFNKPALKLFPELEGLRATGAKLPKLREFGEAAEKGEPVRIGGSIYTPRINILTEDGVGIGSLYSLSDDSEHYRYMDELREQKRIADNANEAKSQFLANMSHEIRTPINAILGFNEMISRTCAKVRDEGASGAGDAAGAAGPVDGGSAAGAGSFDDIAMYSGNIESAGNNLMAIINDILDISRIEAGKMELVEGTYSLSSLLREIEDMITFRAEKKELAFVKEVDGTLPDELWGDMVRIRQVITNVLTNAVKYTDKGTIWLTVGRGEDGKGAAALKDGAPEGQSGAEKSGAPEGQSGADEGGAAGTGDMLELRVVVKDTGIGIRPEDLNKLFGSFERLELERNSTIEGTGLGLSISHRLVSMMGGKIEVSSKYGEGSTFTITIPQRIVSDKAVGDISARKESTDREKKAYRGSFAAPEGRILVVDDTKVNLVVVRELLKETKLAIDMAESGSRALELCAQTGYDVILMDQRMPNMDGTETLKAIRDMQDGPNLTTPVICMTADAIIGSRERYLSEGFDDYISKPVKVKELEDMLVKYLPAEKVEKAEEIE